MPHLSTTVARPLQPARRTRIIALLLFGGLLTLLAIALEWWIGDNRLDERLVRRSLYYQQFIPSLHKPALASPLHYQLRPDARWQGRRQDGQQWSVTIGQHSERGPSHPHTRPLGRKRVLMVGGSTLFGFEVSDTETMAYALERSLETQFGQERVEVWNYGTCAYTTAQAAAQAVELMPQLTPDLVLVQLYNRGRRAYLWPDSDADLPLSAVYAEPQAVLENLPLPALIPANWRVQLIRTSALARAVSAGWRLSFSGAGTMDAESAAGDELSEQWAGELLRVARKAHVPVLFVAIPAAEEQLPEDVHPDLTSRQFMAISADPTNPTTMQVHPPADVLRQWADTIAAAILERKLLN